MPTAFMKQNATSYIAPNKQTDVLWISFQQGDSSAFYQLYDQYADPLYNYGVKITCDRALVEDCIHDLFVELWEKRSSLGIIKSFRHYSYAALRRKIFRNLQKQRKHSVSDREEIQFHLQAAVSHEDQIISHELSEEQLRKLQQAIALLSTRQREVIFLRYFDNFSYEEIASIMSISIESIYKLVSRAVRTIKKHCTELSLSI